MDAYYSVPILPELQKYLKLYIRGKIYLFTYLPNGLCSGPHEFTKLLKSPLSYLRLQQVIAAGFIDILIIMGRSFVIYERNINWFSINDYVFDTQKSLHETVVSRSASGRISDH